EKLAERRAFVQAVGDRYIEAAHADPRLQDDEFLRIGTLQSLGAAELGPFEFWRVCRRIVARGLRDPRQRKILIFSDYRRRIRPLLRWAARESVSLSDADALLQLRAEELDAQNQRSSKDT